MLFTACSTSTRDRVEHRSGDGMICLISPEADAAAYSCH